MTTFTWGSSEFALNNYESRLHLFRFEGLLQLVIDTPAKNTSAQTHAWRGRGIGPYGDQLLQRAIRRTEATKSHRHLRGAWPVRARHSHPPQRWRPIWRLFAAHRVFSNAELKPLKPDDKYAKQQCNERHGYELVSHELFTK